MRILLTFLLAFAMTATSLPSQGLSQTSNWFLQQQRQQQMMQQQQQQQRMQQQQQQEQQRRQMEQQRQQQQAMQQRQQQMQAQQRQMQQQQQQMQQQRQQRMADQRRQQELQRQQAQQRQSTQQKAQQTTRVVRDKAIQVERQRRLVQLQQRTRQNQQSTQAQKSTQQAATVALTMKQTNRIAALTSPQTQQRRQDAAEKFAKLRASKSLASVGSGVAGGGNGSGGGTESKAAAANKKLAQQKLQEFRIRQAVQGAKETKQDVETKAPGLRAPGTALTPVVVSAMPVKLKHIATSGVPIESHNGVTTTVLGKFDRDVEKIIGELRYPKTLDFGAKNGGFNLLNAPNSLYKNSGQFWDKYNKPFLDAAIKRGDRIVLASSPSDVRNLTQVNPNTGERVLSGFGREIEYLKRNGYSYDAKTSTMVKK